MSPKIDDPLEASLEAWPEEPEGWDNKGRELALSFSGLCFTPAAVLKILKDQFLPAKRAGRIQYLFDGLALKLKAIESEFADEREKQKQVQARIEGSQFQEAVAAACEETVRATDERKVQRMAAVLAGSLTPSPWADPKVDLAAMIRDIAQLGDQDVLALGLLKVIFASTIAHLSNLNDQNQFTERMQDYRTAIAQAKIDPEEFNASCARLNGFRLAIEVPRNPARMHPNEYCFRPTRRGLALLDCLERLGPERK